MIFITSINFKTITNSINFKTITTIFTTNKTIDFIYTNNDKW